MVLGPRNIGDLCSRCRLCSVILCFFSNEKAEKCPDSSSVAYCLYYLCQRINESKTVDVKSEKFHLNKRKGIKQ